ncbi:exosortase E/protease, VPEID-CTERM system [Methylobacter sp.]|uniref:exosortase E/protease, VPEID-CTERM system n=1 Tax=Methylobacter sp. TaxID=2051955 RepID=UPI002488A1C9|nr:exosortase E/protease, VPEID-CTERM system [Methylobacter sp.]MDI1276137.1 exosortase E/protease, VPEID-CTERM system [Methylobacter sp.]MDI1356793.1 exosortase E/protease, VPEID-CTERM system [Methylobacter sp.]
MISEYVMPVNMLVTSKRLAIRWMALLAIMAFELIVITARYEVPLLSVNNANWSAWLFHFSKEIWSLSLWIFCACLLIVSPRFKVILSNLREQSSDYRWLVWLAFHILAFIAFAIITALIFETPTNPARLSAPWFTGWFALASATLLLWLLALAPGRFWLRLIRQEQMSLLFGCLLGLCAWMLIGMLVRQEAPLGQKEFWNSLAVPTLQLVHSLLGWVYSDLVYQPERFLLGTADFQVEISYACSGIEGISLITVFLAIYLWLFRKELRFPQAFWLFPLGIITIWLANALRIAILVVIGASFSSEIAAWGFHRQAGWIAFTLIALGAIALSNRLQFFAATQPDVPVRTAKPLAAALLVPFLVLMAVSMMSSAFSSGFDTLYPLRVVAIVIALYYFRKAYAGLGWRWTWQAPAIGTAVFIIWILLEPDIDSSKTALSQGLAELTSGSAAAWLVFRVLGSVITVPLAEELAFRGYLIRKLIAKDFENVPLVQFSWFSFMLTSVLFGLLHERWIAGTLAGMCYALALYRRGQIGDAVIAHMTTNALIAIFVLTQARWSLWS